MTIDIVGRTVTYLLIYSDSECHGEFDVFIRSWFTPTASGNVPVTPTTSSLTLGGDGAFSADWVNVDKRPQVGMYGVNAQLRGQVGLGTITGTFNITFTAVTIEGPSLSSSCASGPVSWTATKQ